MSEQHVGCADYERAASLSRRRFLQGMAAAGAGAVATTMFDDAVRQTAYGATTGGNVLVVISLRGGIDGLGMVVPHGDPGYYAARPSIGVAAASLVAKDSFFGLHPSNRSNPSIGAGRSPPCMPWAWRGRTGRTSSRWRRSRTPTPPPASGRAG